MDRPRLPWFVEDTGRFALKDRYRVENGTYVDGAPAITGLGC